MVNLFGSFSKIKSQKIMVVGDLMLDSYTVGKVRRISPEAPVAVLQVQREEHRPGGAGNVALNLISMGAEVLAVGRTGADDSGEILVKALEHEGILTTGIVTQQGFQTPVKNRIIANNQQIVRVDHEQILPLHELLEQQVIESLPNLMEGVSLVAISDYGKGFVTRTLIGAVVEEAKKKGILVIADPKGVDFTKYRGAHVVKPNLSETYAAANLPPEASLELAATRVLEVSEAEVLMVTRSEAGISLFHKDGKREDFPVHIREVNDVTGAGDTVLAMLSTAMSNNLSVGEATQLSNVAAGIAIERFGCARITLSDLARQLLEDDVGNKVFDEEHLFALQEALRGRRYCLLGLSSHQELTTKFFHTIRKLARRENWDLLVYIRDVEPQEPFVEALASLHDVDYIIIKSHSLEHLCKLMTPDEVYTIEGEDLKKVEETSRSET